MKLIFPSLVLILLCGCEKKHDPVYAPVVSTSIQQTVIKTPIILAMGQSNMAGQPGFSPALGFQAAYPQYQVINCAVGGTSITQWTVDGALFQACLKAVSTGTVVGILWYQGEADAERADEIWDQQFTAIVRGWRTLWVNVPIVYAQLATHDPVLIAQSWDDIKQQQSALTIQNAMMVKTEDLPRQDHIHLTDNAWMTVGQRMAQAFKLLSLEKMNLDAPLRGTYNPSIASVPTKWAIVMAPEVRNAKMSQEKAGRLMSNELWLCMLATVVRCDRTD